MTDKIKRLIEDYHATSYMYQKMLDYYNGVHDIYVSRSEPNRCSLKCCMNYIGKFCEEEIGYAFASPITFVSRDGNQNCISDIEYSLYHLKSTHNQELMRQLEIFGTVYELAYINADGLFCSRILNPTNSIIYTDADNVPQIFIHFYKLKYDDSEYYDIYYCDRIEIYKDNVLKSTKKHIFSGVPVSVCSIGVEQTIYNKIKSLNDALNQILTDNVGIISDYKNAYLTILGPEVTGEIANELKNKGILNIPGAAGEKAHIGWLMKEMNDSYITNTIKKLEDSIYAECLHIDGNFQIQSNTSGAMLRNRLLFLEQRVKMVVDTVADTILDRIKFLFEYLSLKNKNYDWRDISVVYSPSIPMDTYTIAQEINLLGDKISLETALGRLPYIENPQIEIAKIKKERAELEEIDLDKINAV